MSLWQIATAAHLAGSLILALFFVLLARHDPRPYLRNWTAAWVAQVLALGMLSAASREGWGVLAGFFLFFQSLHGALIAIAAQSYARGLSLGRAHAVLLVPLLAWAAAGPALLPDAWTLQAAQFAILAAPYLAACIRLWPLREPGGMGLRLTANVLGLLGLLYAVYAAVFAWTVRSDAESRLHLEMAPFLVLFLQMLLGLGMVLAVAEAAQWALAATNEQLKEAERRLKVLAETDSLTGCFNRRVFRDLVDDVRAGDPSAGGVVILLDMDGLKAVNDQWGHAAGDEAIRRVAGAVKSRTRGSDLVVRWGGDEFVVVLPGASFAEGEGRRAQIVAAIVEAGLSASAGLASYGPEKDIMVAVEEADRAMYQAKGTRKGVGASG